jgi:hypothetical protein
MEGKRNDITLLLDEKTIKSIKKQLMSKCAETARMPLRKWNSPVSDKRLSQVPHFSSVANGEGKPFKVQ